MPNAWDAPQITGQAEAPRMFGGIVAPVLAGFSLGTIALLVTAGGPPLAGAAILALTIAVVALLGAMQFSTQSVVYSTRPAARRELHPEIAGDIARLNMIRNAQFRERRLEDWYATAARYSYNAGLLAFLAGVVLLTVPHRWDAPRVLVEVILGLAMLAELIWSIGPLARLVFPSADSGWVRRVVAPPLQTDDDAWRESRRDGPQ
ncbi:MAG TPA: hypothetical protein VIA06_15465 [Candidatus Dormibacteraeota bacterium]|jgi:hypothetical protein|nr:hypothetical protein [Candidatus Dormibacteraeota bacterium]